jgi:hypothetical protein
MNTLLIAIILALIPVVNMVLRYYFTTKSGDFKSFKKHITFELSEIHPSYPFTPMAASFRSY